MPAIEYQDLPVSEIDVIGPFWEKLREHHAARATAFVAEFAVVTFKERKQKLLAGRRELRIFLARETENGQIAGYCVASVLNDGNGELDSLYILDGFRGCGIGREFMERTLGWFIEQAVTDISISVAVGNEEALPFYEKFGFMPRTYVLKRKRK
jgi:ribosomal protein S18 acetylase RimI-like enzyme